MSDIPLQPHNEDWFQNTNWDELLGHTNVSIDYMYSELLKPQITEARITGNQPAAYVLSLLNSVCENHFILEGEATFTEPVYPFSPTLDNLTSDDLQVLAAFLPEVDNPGLDPLITNPELRAKIADTLRYLEFGDVEKYAEIAVEGYLESASKLEQVTEESIFGGFDTFTDKAEDRISRALQIAKLQGKSSDVYSQIIQRVANSVTEMMNSTVVQAQTISNTNNLLFKLNLLLDEEFINSSNASKYNAISSQKLDDAEISINLAQSTIESIRDQMRTGQTLLTSQLRQTYSNQIFDHGTLIHQTGRWTMLAARLSMIEGNEAQAEQQFRKVLDVWERMAVEGLRYGGIQNEMASIYIRNAIILGKDSNTWPLELRNLSIDLTQRINDLHRQFIEYQSDAVKDKIPTNLEDLERIHGERLEVKSNDIREARELGELTVKGETLPTGLLKLINLPFTPGYDLVFQTISLSDMLFTTTVRDIENKVKSLISLTGENWNEAVSYVILSKPLQPQDEAAAITFFREKFPGMLYLKANQLSSLPSQTVAGAIQQIQIEHGINLEIPDAVLQSPFINPANQYMAKRALDEGLNGNWNASAHLLSTVFEDSIRHILQEEGVIPNNVRKNGIQKNYRLEQIFQKPDAIQKLESIFDEETVLALRMVLNEKMGHNFRNRVQHGFVTGIELNGGDNIPAQYMWWLYLKMTETATQTLGRTNTLNITPSPNWFNKNIDPASQLYGESLVRGKTTHEALDNLTQVFASPQILQIEFQVTNDPAFVTPQQKQEEIRRQLSLHYKPIADTVRASLQIIANEASNYKDLFNAIQYYIEDSRFIKHREYATGAVDDRSDYYARALFAGMQGDGLLSIHTLLPQIEESIRNILQENGSITSFILTDDEKQDDYPLNELFKKYKTEIISILGEETTLDLEGLLIDKHKFNLRNLALHGLLEKVDYKSDEAVYLWWLTMKIIGSLK